MESLDVGERKLDLGGGVPRLIGASAQHRLGGFELAQPLERRGHAAGHPDRIRTGFRGGFEGLSRLPEARQREATPRQPDPILAAGASASSEHLPRPESLVMAPHPSEPAGLVEDDHRMGRCQSERFPKGIVRFRVAPLIGKADRGHMPGIGRIQRDFEQAGRHRMRIGMTTLRESADDRLHRRGFVWRQRPRAGGLGLDRHANHGKRAQSRPARPAGCCDAIMPA